MSEQLTGAQLMGIMSPEPATVAGLIMTPEPSTVAGLFPTVPVPATVVLPEGEPLNPETAPKSVLMIDTIHADVANIPPGTPKVAGYDTGSPDIDWTPADWERFPHSGHVIIDQTPGLARYGAGVANVADVETRAGLIPDWVIETRARLARGEDGWIYGGRTTIEDASAALTQAGVTAAELGKVGAWLADWNLNQAEAEALLGTKIAGLVVVAVQWASPSLNPHTIVPGGTKTLAEANVDLSATNPGWFAYVAPKPPPPPVTGVTKAEAEAALVVLGKFVAQ